MNNEYVGITSNHRTQKRPQSPKDPGTPLPVTAKFRLVCYYRKLNKKLPADFWSYEKGGQRIDNGINTPYPLPCIDEMLASIRGCKFLMTLDCTGAFHGLRLSPDTAKKLHGRHPDIIIHSKRTLRPHYTSV